jgi:DHA1 family bicyclomycin/chloramphenicol resistance-like MFS transporter
MSGAGLVVGTVHRLGLEPKMMIATLMLSITPALLILISSTGKKWHQVSA